MRLPLLVAATLFMEFLDATALTPALPNIAAAMGVHPIDLNPAVSAYALTLAVFILPSGWISERIGVRPTFAMAIAIFTFSSALCALSWSPMTLMAARALQGIGGAMMAPVGRFVVLRTTPKSEIMRAMAYLIWPALSAPLIGPVAGGYLTGAFSWRAIFLINLPLGAVAFIIALVLVPDVEESERKPFDWLGFLLCGGFLVALLASLDQLAGAPAASALPYVAAAGALLILSAIHLRRHSHPLIEFQPLAHPTFRHTIFGGSLTRILINAVPFLLPLMFQLCMGYDPLHAGLALTPLFLGNLAIKPLTTPILNRFGFRSVLIVNGALQALTMAGCCMIVLSPSALWIAPLLFVSGASRSLQYTALATLTFADVPQDEMNMANLIQSTTHHASFAFGVGVGAALVKIGAAIWPDNRVVNFQFAFLALAAMMLAATVEHARIARDSGHAVLKRKAA